MIESNAYCRSINVNVRRDALEFTDEECGLSIEQSLGATIGIPVLPICSLQIQPQYRKPAEILLQFLCVLRLQGGTIANGLSDVRMGQWVDAGDNINS